LTEWSDISTHECPKTLHCADSNECDLCTTSIQAFTEHANYVEDCKGAYACQASGHCQASECDAPLYNSCLSRSDYHFCNRGTCENVRSSTHEDCTDKGLIAFCQADGRCMYSTSECDIADHYTCDGITNYCEEGTCAVRDCDTSNCLKAPTPEWTYEEENIEIDSQTGWSLDSADFITNSVDDVDLELTV
jgi:hypothetical protein